MSQANLCVLAGESVFQSLGKLFASSGHSITLRRCEAAQCDVSADAVLALTPLLCKSGDTLETANFLGRVRAAHGVDKPILALCVGDETGLIDYGLHLLTYGLVRSTLKLPCRCEEITQKLLFLLRQTRVGVPSPYQRLGSTHQHSYRLTQLNEKAHHFWHDCKNKLLEVENKLLEVENVVERSSPADNDLSLHIAILQRKLEEIRATLLPGLEHEMALAPDVADRAFGEELAAFKIALGQFENQVAVLTSSDIDESALKVVETRFLDLKEANDKFLSRFSALKTPVGLLQLLWGKVTFIMEPLIFVEIDDFAGLSEEARRVCVVQRLKIINLADLKKRGEELTKRLTGALSTEQRYAIAGCMDEMMVLSNLEIGLSCDLEALSDRLEQAYKAVDEVLQSTLDRRCLNA